MNTINHHHPAPDQVLSKAAVAALIGVSPSSIDRWCRSGGFPPKLRLGPGRVGWRKTAVEAWLAERETAA